MKIKKYRISNHQGLSVEFINLGGIITAINLQMEEGERNVVLAYDDADKYITNPAYLGAIVGPIGGRVGGGLLSLSSGVHQLSKNTSSGHHLHGGNRGFDQRYWDVKMIDDMTCELLLEVDRSQEGYPGKQMIKVIYQVTNDNEFTITYEFESNKVNYMNPTQHTYFNLAGHGDTKNHYLAVEHQGHLQVDDTGLPTGEVWKETPILSKQPMEVGEILNMDMKPLVMAKGIDHPFLVQEGMITRLSVNDLIMEVKTDAPACVIYTGNYLEALETGFTDHQGICFETQEVPDGMNNRFGYSELAANCPRTTWTTFKFVLKG